MMRSSDHLENPIFRYIFLELVWPGGGGAAVGGLFFWDLQSTSYCVD